MNEKISRQVYINLMKKRREKILQIFNFAKKEINVTLREQNFAAFGQILKFLNFGNSEN